MLKTMTATEAKNNFSEIIDSVHAKGNTVTITRHNRPVAKIVPVSPALKKAPKKAFILSATESKKLEKGIKEFRENFKFSF